MAHPGDQISQELMAGIYSTPEVIEVSLKGEEAVLHMVIQHGNGG
jgi:hypothetical protein